MPIAYEDYVTEIVVGKASQRLDDSFLDIMHGAIGAATELGELSEAFATGDIINVKEELGDCLWYLTLIGYGLGQDIKARAIGSELAAGMITMARSVSYEAMIVRRFSAMLDTIKKGLFYGKGLDRETLFKQLALSLAIVEAIARDVCKCSLDDIMQLNAEKLRKRYVANFTPEEAAQRDLVEERKALESR